MNKETILSDRSNQTDIQVILFLSLPHWTKVPSLSLIYLENLLAQKGFKAKIVDLNIIFYNLLKLSKKEWLTLNSEFESNIFKKIKLRFPEIINELIKEIVTSQAKILGFSMYSRNRKATMELACEIHKAAQSKTFVFGGPEVLFEYHRGSFFDEFDSNNTYFVLGEGELPLLHICETIYNASELKTLLYKGKKMIVYDEIPNIDSLPLLNFDSFDITAYNPYVLPLFSSRGCIKRCSFCSECKLYKKFRQHSAEYMIELIKFLKNKHKISAFSFHDSLINADLEWLDEFCRLLIKENLKIKWEAQLAIRNDMTSSLLETMKMSGCYNLFIGLESACDKILESMRKGYDSSQAKELFAKCSLANLQYEISLIVGFPEENERDFTQTLQFLKENKRYIPKIAQVNPFIEYTPSQINKQKTRLNQIAKNRIARLLEMFKQEKIKYTSSFINNLTQE